MSLTRVQDVSVHDIRTRKKPRKHYVSSFMLLSFVLWQVATLFFIAPCKRILDSLGFWIPRRGFQVLYSAVFVSGIWIPVSSL